MVKELIGAVAVAVCLGAVPASAQSVPGGSYLRTCTNVEREGDRLFADCRRIDGDWQRTALYDIRRCSGGITNSDGRLTCDRGRREYGWHRDYDRWNNYGWNRDRDWRESYGFSGYYYPHEEWYGR